MLYILCRKRNLRYVLKAKGTFEFGKTVIFQTCKELINALKTNITPDVIWMETKDYEAVSGNAQQFEQIKALYPGNIYSIGLPPREKFSRFEIKLINFFSKPINYIRQHNLLWTEFPFRFFFWIISHYLWRIVGVYKAYITIHPQRLGHLCYNTMIGFRMIQKRHKRVRIHAIIASVPPANPVVLNLWVRECAKVIIDPMLLDFMVESGITGLPFIYDTTFMGDAHEPLQNYSKIREPFLSLHPEENKHGMDILQKMGIKRPFICFHNRDKAYLDKKHAYLSREQWSYHDFRDSGIDTYTEAAYYLTKMGYDVVRIGNEVEMPFSFPDNPNIFDYANSEYKSPFMDVFLLANCEFLLGACTGLTQLATILGTRVAVANWCHLELSSCFYPGDIIMPKDYYHDSGDFMSPLPLEIQLESGIGHIVHGNKLKDRGISLTDNSSEDILELAKEALAYVPFEETSADVIFHRIMDNPKYLCEGTPVKLAGYYAITRPWFLERMKNEG